MGGADDLTIDGEEEGKGDGFDGVDDLIINCDDEGGGGGGKAGEIEPPFPNALRAACIAKDGGVSWNME